MKQGYVSNVKSLIDIGIFLILCNFIDNFYKADILKSEMITAFIRFMR